MSIERVLHPLVPNAPVPGDWYQGVVPHNIRVGDDCLIDSAHTFHQFNSTADPAVLLGDRVTLWSSRVSSVETGVLEIGDDCHLQGAAVVVAEHITIGDRCVIGNNVTIFDSDFHPLGHLDRRADAWAVRPLGDGRRARSASAPVRIGSDVWISPGAIVGKGVTVGDGVQILPGAVVLRDIESGAVVAGNPAEPV